MSFLNSLKRKFYIVSVVTGLATTGKRIVQNLFGLKPKTTIEYPEKRRNYSNKFMGVHVLTRKSDGDIACTACMLCATNCPADCIHIVAAESPKPTVEKYPAVYEIDLMRCVFCGLCEEACPVDAVRMGRDYEYAELSERNFVVGIEYLADRPALKGRNISVFHETNKIFHSTVRGEQERKAS